MNKKSLLAALILAAFSVLSANAQQMLSVPYQCGFEEADSTELANWVLNSGQQAASCADRWIVGEATKNAGRRSLYISDDGGMSNEFGAQRNVIYAYRDFTLPQGSYDCTFDWRCIGSSNSSLYVGIGVANNTNCDAILGSGNIPQANVTWCKADTRDMRGKSAWQNSSITFNSNGTRVLRLFFCWANANVDTSLTNPIAAAIDNIQITSSNCAKPGSIDVITGCDTVIISWKGTSEKYQMDYKRRGTDLWRTRSEIYTNRVILEGLQEGAYDFRVRGICNQTDTSAYAYANGVILFCPERHCINYVSLRDSSIVTATYGTTRDPMANIGIVDHGIDEKMSRHSVCWDPDTYDLRTGGRLRMIPDGELASIRLGNWNNGAEAETVSYKYVVDSVYSILLLKYAVVLEDPNHNKEAQPRFTLEILDEFGYPIDPTCGAADFYADRNREGWNVNNQASTPITWKDWTIIGLNLEQYVGQTLTIRLATYDCTASAHFGYAYFTLGCSAAKIEGISCGSDAQLSVQAPNGFDYEWFNKYDSLVSTNQILAVESSDTTTYRCHLSYKEERSCGFDLYSSVLPRYPVSDFTWVYEPANCENRVRFINKSHIMTDYEGKVEHHYDMGCDDYRWYFHDGTVYEEKSPIITFPNEGGTFAVNLHAYLSNFNCENDTTIYLTIPAIGNTLDTVRQTLCYGDYIMFGRQIVAETGIYYDSLKNVAGCDSVTVLDLTVNPQSYTDLPDTTLCYGEPLCIDGDCYRGDTSGVFVRFLKNVHGCDSTLHTNVTILDKIAPTLETDQILNVPNSGRMTIGGTGFSGFELIGRNNHYRQSFTSETTLVESLPGGYYDVIFYNDFGCSLRVEAVIQFECLEAQLGTPEYACHSAHVNLPVTVQKGMADLYSVFYDEAARRAGFADVTDRELAADQILLDVPSDPLPGNYTASVVLHDVMCEPDTFNIRFTINYDPDSVVTQRWNDLLAVTSVAARKYGSFTAYQWYKDGLPISGATRSQYYSGNTPLDSAATYSVSLTRLSDGMEVITCPFSITAQPSRSSLRLLPSSTRMGQAAMLRSSEAGTAEFYTHSGLRVASLAFQPGDTPCPVDLPQGVYIIRVSLRSGEQHMLKLIVE